MLYILAFLAIGLLIASEFNEVVNAFMLSNFLELSLTLGIILVILIVVLVGLVGLMIFYENKVELYNDKKDELKKILTK